MRSFYQSYIRAFTKFAESTLNNKIFFITLSRYAIILNDKANELIKRASLNARIDLPKLRKELYELGVSYVRKFSENFKHKDKHIR